MERRMQSDSNEGYEGVETLVILRKERKRKATPPPQPEGRGTWRREKLGGVKEESAEGGDEGESQVSERERISMDWSAMKSRRVAGLSRREVTEVTERVFR